MHCNIIVNNFTIVTVFLLFSAIIFLRKQAISSSTLDKNENTEKTFRNRQPTESKT